MIYTKCKTCRNRNTDNCPLKKKDVREAKVENEATECFEIEECDETPKGKGVPIIEGTVKKKKITGDLFRRMVLNASAYIKKNAEKINDLNVFPVPDGDTGSNMSMTIGSAVNDLRKGSENDEIGDVAALTASAMLRGARGNSGVILSLLFRGISKELKGVCDCDGVAFANALKSGVDAAYKAVTSPAEGTILTVARVAAERAIDAANEENNAEYVLEAAIDAASDALEATVEQNPVLKKAGVVDAGGMGWVVALTAMLDAIHGNELEIQDNTADLPESKSAADFGDFNTEDIKFAYCTEFIVSRENDKDPDALRTFLSELGDSLVVVSDEEIIKVHVHTNAPGTAMQEALTYGSFLTVKVENMKLQHTEKISEEKATVAPKEPEKDFGAVAVAPGDGIAETFVSLGVDVTVSGGQTMNPSTEDILNAVNKVNAKTVFVLPNNKNIILAAEQAAMISEKKIVVIPTRSTPEGIAAMQGYDVQLTEEEITEAMTEMAATADTMQITYAARNSEFDGMHISEGEYLALYAGKLAGNGRDLNSLLRTLANRAKAAGKEIITIYYGEDVTEEDAEAVASLFIEQFDEDSVMLIRGGQPVYYYIISAE